ncbi:hypothetical protein K443DRAFT_7706 [Laccaria amethystina LaAM-08-1]|uniref:Unplaced genomic scaffold K443scaffold_91, whole genome shotgun sequence n=1 Tax=Laccaria amethystina LaAM-08-1 TaxID=1095629 RepID=A0A0C9WQC5_9AGAR|nr:hypothetical protein K443DRAFT_7706 [Laccaria amethystina LaAM-08-1]
MLAVQPSHFETRLAYRLWMLTYPNPLFKRRVSVETIFRTSPSSTHLALLSHLLSMRCSIFTALVVAIVLTLTSASPIPIDTNEVGAREAQLPPGCTPFTCT